LTQSPKQQRKTSPARDTRDQAGEIMKLKQEIGNLKKENDQLREEKKKIHEKK